MTQETALLEIGTEELPARFFYEALPQMEALAAKLLASNRLHYEKIDCFGTPRRLVLEILNVEAHQPDQKKEVRGPAKASAYQTDGNPSPALTGFLKSQNVSMGAVGFKEFSGKPYVVIQVEEKGKPTPQVLSALFPDLISQLTFPKSMRWSGNFLFGRPIRWILALFGKTIVNFELAGLKSGSVTYGHRVYSPKPISISSPGDYKKKLETGEVISDHRTRCELIRKEVAEKAASKSGTIYQIDSLLDEVTLLVEYPTAFLGSFHERFLGLPQDVLITVMQHHQRYFPVIGKNGKLLPHFVAVRNGSKEGLDDVRDGNEQVIRARFKDAEYFFETDKKTKLLDRTKTLEKLTFLKNLGTFRQKVERLTRLVPDVMQGCGLQNETNAKDLELVIQLCKCDLATQMVFEFPELQGVMGKEYATREGYPESVCQGILDHYLPKFPGGPLPQTTIGTLLAITDRLDTLVGCFGINQKPSGSSDPLGLRRAAATLLQILVEKNLNLDFEKILPIAFNQFSQSGLLQESVKEKTILELRAFIQERNEYFWKSAGIRYDLIRAVSGLALKTPVGALRRARFLEERRSKEKEKFTSVILAWVRVANILKSKEAKAFMGQVASPSPETLKEEEEKKLLENAGKLTPEIKMSLGSDKLNDAWKKISDFEAPINAFFDKVLVMAPEEEIRKNRLALLSNLHTLMLESFGDVTEIVLD